MIISIDVGGTKISAALIDNNQIVEQRKTESIIHHDLANLANYLLELCHDWIEKSDQLAVACTGQVGKNQVNFLSAKKKLPLKQQLVTAFNLPVTIINDAAAAAWAEYCLSDNNVDNTLVYVTVSTGIGGGVIQNGQLVTSNDGFCAHLGHVSVHHSGKHDIQCHCGRINCVEAISSGTAIAKQASAILNKQVTCEEVFEHYLSHPAIAELIDNCTSAVTDLIANIKATTGTSRVVLGGSVGLSPVFKTQVLWKVAQLPEIYRVEICSPASGKNADLIGASLYAQSNCQQTNLG